MRPIYIADHYVRFIFGKNFALHPFFLKPVSATENLIDIMYKTNNILITGIPME